MSFHGHEGLTHDLELGSIEATLGETAFNGLRIIEDRRKNKGDQRQIDRSPPPEENNRQGMRDRRQTPPMRLGKFVIFEPGPASQLDDSLGHIL